MKQPIIKFTYRSPALAALVAACLSGPVAADPTDISNTPLSASSAGSVLPNLMFVLDDSGSMARDYLPDFVPDNDTCKTRLDSGGWGGPSSETDCSRGDPPYYSPQFNTVYYNPQITYRPPVDFDGTPFASQISPWTSVKDDGFFSSSGTTNLVSKYQEIRYCTDDTASLCRRNGIDTNATFEYREGSPDNGKLYGYPESADVQIYTSSGNISYSSNTSTAACGSATRLCRTNSSPYTITVKITNHGLSTGDQVSVSNNSSSNTCSDAFNTGGNFVSVTVVDANTFTYSDTGTSTSNRKCTFTRLAYKYANTIDSVPHYYTITPKEHCSDADLVNCVASTAPTTVSGTAYNFPANIRYCKSRTDAHAAAPVSGNSGTPATAKCRAKYDSTYDSPRYGNFTRTDIVPATASYGNRPKRNDCAGVPTCTYAEEMTNFANWYTYYRTRMQMMKSAAGRAFLPIDDRYRVGFITINPGSPVDGDKYLKIEKFEPGHKEDWYELFYEQTSNSGTPLREALSRVGRHFAGVQDGINDGMGQDPMQYSCQQNFTILTTDGYWNGNAGQDENENSIGNQDNVNSGYSTRSAGAFDGNVSGASDTLADVALYYYKTDLRGTGSLGALNTDVSNNNVPTSPKDTAPHQHMTTFTLGIVDGLMTYRSDYETASTGDFAKIKAASSGCFWASGTCNWPLPKEDQLSALDDLWHAAVNGRGTFYLSQDPNQVADGLSAALAGLNIRTAAAAASATSSPNITPTDRSIYSSTYTTVEWAGQVVAQDIDSTTGAVVPAIKWAAQGLLDAKVAAATDTRTLHMFDPAGTNKLKPFLYTSMTAAEQANFANKCVPASNLSQCILLTAAELTVANTGKNMVNFLRGQTQHEGTVYRDRIHTLGDTVNATPAYMREPRFDFADAVSPTYASFKTANASRQSTLFIAANDGMLHAFNADNGQEMWAYVPKIVMPSLYKLAEKNYSSKHVYLVDGSPALMDAFIGGAWKTMLVGGFNSGARGYYALDVTDPSTPKGMWEICHDATLCAISDADMGLSFGNPVITKRASDGKWVVLVTSGYNNTSPGTGRGYLYVLDAETGAVLEKLDTGAGDTTTPAGLGRISAWADNGNINNTAKYVYGGDLQGNLWAFDLTTSPSSVFRLGQLTDASGRPQSVTTRPELGQIQSHRVIFVGTGRYLGVSDLQDPATWAPPSTDAWQQSIYAIKDKGADYGDIRTSAGLVEQTITVIDATSRTTSSIAVDWNSDNGWYADFNPSDQSPGERVSIDPQLVLGTLLVETNVPNDDACNIGGDSWQYQFTYDSGQYISTSPGNVVGTKLSNAITVGVVVVRLPSGQLKAIATDAAGTKTPFGVNIGGSAASGKRTGWRELTQ
jgi:type IV pilus assembly protein PilY1